MPKKHFPVILIAAFTLMLVLGSDLTQAAEKVYRWRAVTHQLVGTSRYTETVVAFCDMVEKASNGRLIIEPYGAGVLFPNSESFDAIRDGMVQMGMLYSGFWGSKHQLFTLHANRPGGPLKTFEENFYRTEKVQPLMEKLYERFGVKFLGVFDYAPPEILVSTAAIRTYDDFKGKNIRTGGLGGLFYSRLGASVVNLSAPEVYQALQLGTVDAAEYNDWLVNKEMAFDEVTKYVIEPALHTDATDDKDLIVNPDAWNELPEDLKAIVIACRDMARYKSAVAYGAGNEIAKQSWIDKGIEIIYLSPEDVARIRQDGTDLMLEMAEKDPLVKEYIDSYAQVLDELGYQKEAAMLGFNP
ncbi:MAG: TRAP transporter substrate-binding protein DctP [Planctomycetaceae bacterium]|nr:TRAP transporter substrate-binding protein DctP [Planctomycetaceae bacterium]